MNKKFLKLMSLALVVMMMSVALVACGGGDDKKDDGALTEEEYIAKVQEISTTMSNMQTTINEKMATIDPTDEEAVDALFEEIKAPFVEFAALKAPAKYEAAQAKFKSGCEAMVEFIDTAKALSKDPASADANKLQDLLTTAMTDIMEGAQLAEEADAK